MRLVRHQGNGIAFSPQTPKGGYGDIPTTGTLPCTREVDDPVLLRNIPAIEDVAQTQAPAPTTCVLQRRLSMPAPSSRLLSTPNDGYLYQNHTRNDTLYLNLCEAS